MVNLIYFSNVSNGTHRFVKKLEIPSLRIPYRAGDETPVATQPYVLIVPTYGDSQGRGMVPRQVGKFLNIPENRRLIRGVIACGNINFGEDFAMAGDIISEKCKVPFMYKFEISGLPEDVINVKEGLEQFWHKQR